jgi:hypothetical protein
MEDNKRDVVIEGRLSSMDLAICAKFLFDKGIVPRNNSDLLNLCIQMAAFATKLDTFNNVTEARQYLTSIGIGSLNRSNRNKSIANRAMQEEALSADGFNPDYGKVKTTVKDVPSSDEDWQQQVQQAFDSISSVEGKVVNEAAFLSKERVKSEELSKSLSDAVKVLIDKKG